MSCQPEWLEAADVAHLARADEGVERLQRLLQRREPVPLVRLVEVDVVRAQAPEARLALRGSGVAGRGRSRWAHPPPACATFVARSSSSRRPGDRLAEYLLGLAVGVHVGGVEEVDAGVEAHVHLPGRAGDVGVADHAEIAAPTEGHRAEGQGRDVTDRSVLDDDTPWILLWSRSRSGASLARAWNVPLPRGRLARASSFDSLFGRPSRKPQRSRRNPSGRFDVRGVAAILDDLFAVAPAAAGVGVEDGAGLGDHGLGREHLGAGPSLDVPEFAQVAEVEQGSVGDDRVVRAPEPRARPGVGPMAEKRERSQYLGEMALFMPRVPGATPGQLSETVRSPG